MTERAYIERLTSLWPVDGETSKEAQALADEAVRAFPRSAELWCMRGDLIQLGSADCVYGLEDALACYEQATSVDPKFAEAYEEIGHFYDAVVPDPKRARSAFRKAASLRRSNV